MDIKELKYINNNSSSLINKILSDVSGVKERKRIVNRFDIGKNQLLSTGRQTTMSVDTGQFESTPGYTGYNNLASTYKRLITPTILTGLGLAGSLATSLLGQYTSPMLAASTNASTAIAKGLVTSSGAFTEAGAEAAMSAGYQTAGNGLQAGGVGTEAALRGAGSSVANAGLSALGYATSIAGTAYGLYNTFEALNNFDNRITDSDMQNASSVTTLTKYGRAYSQYGGFDENGIFNATKQQNAADVANLSSATMGTGMAAGAGIGSLLGSYGGPIGMAIGAIGGLIAGLFGGGSAAAKRRHRVEIDAANTKDAQGGWNIQQEAEAASLGLRDMNRASSRNVTTGILNADKGKNPGQSMNKFSLGKIYTPQGVTVGEQRGLASPDEGEIDMATGETLYNGSPSFKVKDKRADIVPVGTPGKADGGLNGDYFDHFVAIPGHKKFANGITPADLARPYFKDNEQVKDMIASVESGKGDKNTKKYMLNKLLKRYSDNSNAIANIVRAQLNMPLFSCGKNAKYALGKVDWGGLYDELNPLIGLSARIPYAIAEQTAANADQPYAYNSFVPNSTALSALAVLGGLGYDPSADLADLIRIGRQNRYNIMNTGNLSAGQKAALSSNSNIQLGAQRRAVLADAYNKNAAFKQAYANALMQHGQNEATRAQQALATQQEQYRQAVGAKLKWQEQARKNWYTIANQTLQDFSTNKYQNKMYDLWNKQLEIDRMNVEGNSKGDNSRSTVVQGSQELPSFLRRPAELFVQTIPFDYNRYPKPQPVGWNRDLNGYKWNWKVK